MMVGDVFCRLEIMVDCRFPDHRPGRMLLGVVNGPSSAYS